MQIIKREELPEQRQVRLTIAVDKDTWQASLAKCYQGVKSVCPVAGEPTRENLEQAYGPEFLYQEAVNDTYPQALVEAISQSDIQIAGTPTLSVETIGPDGYTFAAVIDLYPEVELGQYKGLSAVYPQVELSNDDTEAALFARYFDAETVAVQRATLMVLRSQERRVAARVMDTKTFKNTAVAHAWNSYADADPLADVNRAKDYFRYSVGLKPNALIMDEDVLKHISMCDAVMERIKYTSPNAIRGELTMEQLKAYFSLPNIIVAGAVYNKAAKRRPKEIAAIWPTDMIMLACLSSGGQNLKEPCLGRTFLWEEDSPGMLTTEQYREEQTRSDIYRVRQNTDECIQFTGAGYILTGVTEEKNSELP